MNHFLFYLNVMIFRGFEAYPILFMNISRLKISKTLPGKRIIAALLIEPYLDIILSNLDKQINKNKGGKWACSDFFLDLR